MPIYAEGSEFILRSESLEGDQHTTDGNAAHRCFRHSIHRSKKWGTRRCTAFAYKGAVTLRSSFVATIVALLFVFLLGGFPDSSSQLPESTVTEPTTGSPNIGSNRRRLT